MKHYYHLDETEERKNECIELHIMHSQCSICTVRAHVCFINVKHSREAWMHMNTSHTADNLQIMQLMFAKYNVIVQLSFVIKQKSHLYQR